ncbi:MAG: hypothetical protein ACRCW2_02325 [Cellulosilyticaceae bacterium]
MIKAKNTLMFMVLGMILLGLVACSNNTSPVKQDVSSNGEFEQIYLYGEAHGVKKILDREFELWYDYYHEQGMRHLFIEFPYYTAEFLNIWMQSDNDEILNEVYADLKGTQGGGAEAKEFYEKIKKECPETVFHGTDVGHQYATTGKRFLEYLKQNGLEDSEQYTLTQESIEQGKRYYEQYDHVYRENKMTENFVREFDKLSGESIMGIYGAAHTRLEDMDYYTKSVPCMANQLTKNYASILHTEDLSAWAKDIEPYRIDTINVAGKDYDASYFGEQDLTGFTTDYKYRAFWRLENGYDDFKDRDKTQDVLPYGEYPMLIEKEQVFVIDYIKLDNSVERKYYRSDGRIWNELPSTEEFIID